MNVTPIANGLTPQLVEPIARRYIDHNIYNYEERAILTGTCACIIAGVATAALSGFVANYVESIGHFEEVSPLYPMWWSQQVWVGDYPRTAFFLKFFTVLSSTCAAIVTATKTYGKVFKMGKASYEKFEELAKGIARLYEAQANIPGHEIAKLMAKVDKVTQRQFIELMSFDQIAEARPKESGFKELRSLLEEISERKEQHYLWLDLVKLTDLSSDAILKKIKGVAFQQQLKYYPKLLSIVQEIIGPHERYSSVKTYIIQNQFFHTMPTQAELDSKETITLTLPKGSTLKPLVLNKALLCKASSVIKTRQTWKDPGKYEIDEKEYAAFAVFAKSLQGQEITKKEYLASVETFEKYNIQWENYIIANLDQFSEEEMSWILEYCPHSKVSNLFEERSLALILPLEKVEELLPLTKKYQWTALRDKCLARINSWVQRLESIEDGDHEIQSLLTVCRENLPEDILKKLENSFASLMSTDDLDPQDFRIHYEIAQENKWQSALNNLISYCQNYRRQILDAGIWPLGDIPDKFEPLLYPDDPGRSVPVMKRR